MSGPLFVSLDPFGSLMAGPAVRCLELASACRAAGLEVTVAAPEGSGPGPTGCELVTYNPHDPDALATAARAASAVVVPGTALARFPGIMAADVPIAVDLYCPFLLENLERHRQGNHAPGQPPAAGTSAYVNELRGLNTALARGDFFLCADARQRDYWLGALTALHRVSPATYGEDPQLFGFIATVPFGCPAEPPTPSSPAFRGEVAGLAAESEIILWGGGLSPWFDVETLIRAVAEVRTSRPAAALVLLGAQHPNPDVPESPAVAAARALAHNLGLLDAGVFFVPWVPYADRGRYLTEAALGVSTHGAHLEAHFAFRTRLVDYLWAGLPMVLTRGDGLGARCAALGAALAVDPGDVEGLAHALLRGLDDADWRRRATEACADIASDFTWARVAHPLRAWLQAPTRAADTHDAAGPIVLPPVAGAEAGVTEAELQALRAEAARARELDARLRSVDRKLKLLEGLPGIGRFLKRRREG